MKKEYSLFLTLVLLFSVGLFAQSKPGIEVNNIVVCTSVENRQPVGTDSVFNSEVGELYCFTGLKSQTDTSEISHVWFYKDKQMAKITLPVKAKTWHTWSSKTIMPAWKGNWHVEVQNSKGDVISKISFVIK